MLSANSALSSLSGALLFASSVLLSASCALFVSGALLSVSSALMFVSCALSVSVALTSASGALLFASGVFLPASDALLSLTSASRGKQVVFDVQEAIR